MGCSPRASVAIEETTMADRVIHFEVVWPDGPALQSFYRELFGWAFNTDNPGGYGMVSDKEAGIWVGVGATQDGGPGHVTGYISVPDIDKALATVTRLGGSVVAPKFSPDGTAHLALFADPQGHVIGLSEA
jgi:uncharacterized protein